VSVVDQYVDQHGTRKVAEEYLRYLYSKEGQEIAAKYFYRPRDPDVAARYAKQFPGHSAAGHGDAYSVAGPGRKPFISRTTAPSTGSTVSDGYSRHANRTRVSQAQAGAAGFKMTLGYTMAYLSCWC